MWVGKQARLDSGTTVQQEHASPARIPVACQTFSTPHYEQELVVLAEFVPVGAWWETCAGKRNDRVERSILPLFPKSLISCD